MASSAFDKLALFVTIDDYDGFGSTALLYPNPHTHFHITQIQRHNMNIAKEKWKHGAMRNLLHMEMGYWIFFVDGPCGLRCDTTEATGRYV